MNSIYWDERVKKYGHTGWSNEIIYSFDQPIRKACVSYFIEKYHINGGELLDFGCGTGEFTEKLQNRFDSFTLYDISEDVLSKAKTRLKKMPNCHYVSELKELSRLSTQFSAIISVTVLQHILDDIELNTVLEYMYNQLSSGGVVILIESFSSSLSTYTRSWTTAEFEKIITGKGFSIEEKYNLYKSEVEQEPDFKRYVIRPDIFLSYHLCNRIPLFRKYAQVFLRNKISVRDELVPKYIHRHSYDFGTKIYVLKK